MEEYKNKLKKYLTSSNSNDFNDQRMPHNCTTNRGLNYDSYLYSKLIQYLRSANELPINEIQSTESYLINIVTAVYKRFNVYNYRALQRFISQYSETIINDVNGK